MADKIREAPAALAVEPKTVRGGEETILVVEDETGLLELMRSVLQGYRYHVFAATTGAEALRIWDENHGRIDLLLTDMIMPGGMSGNDLAAKLRQQKPGLKVVYTSGYSSELMEKDSARNDCAFLAKPYLPLQLAQTVRKCLDASPECPHGRDSLPADAAPVPAQVLSVQSA